MLDTSFIMSIYEINGGIKMFNKEIEKKDGSSVLVELVRYNENLYICFVDTKTKVFECFNEHLAVVLLETYISLLKE